MQFQLNNTIIFACISAALLSLVFIATVNSNYIYAQNENFKAKLKGDSEVPPTTSSATAKAKFKAKGDVITFKINITGVTDVTAVHIHAGMKGQSGEPVVDLLKSGKQNKADTGVIKGEIAASDLQGPMAGKTVQDLETAMGNKETYVNVHTSDHPAGEIRGLIKISGGNVKTADSAGADNMAGKEEG
jgi:hypothetical protein